MKEFINKIKQFLKNIILQNKVKQLEAPKENDLIEKNEEKLKKQNDKKEFFEIYNKIKKAEYNLNELTTDQAQKTIDMLKSEINLKQNKLNNDITELNILKADTKNVGGVAKGEMVLEFAPDCTKNKEMKQYLLDRGLEIEEVSEYVD